MKICEYTGLFCDEIVNCQTNSETIFENNKYVVCSGGEVISAQKYPLIRKICNKCGFIFTTSNPLEHKIENYYKDEYSAKLSNIEEDYHNFSMDKSFEQTTIDFSLDINLADKGNYLGIGCGKGFFEREFLKKFPNWNVEGVDPSITSINYAKQNAPSAKFYNDFFSGSNFEKNNYDYITIHAVLNRVYWGTFLHDAVKLVKVGGYISLEIVLLHQSPFELFISDHFSIPYKEHILSFAYQNSLELVKCDLRGSLSRFLFRKISNNKHTDNWPLNLKQNIENSKNIAKQWATLVNNLSELKEYKKPVSFYGAGVTLKYLLSQVDFPEKLICNIFDDAPSKKGLKIHNCEIKPFNSNELNKVDSIFLCAGYGAIEGMKKKILSSSSKKINIYHI